jgi:hypothetical protein
MFAFSVQLLLAAILIKYLQKLVASTCDITSFAIALLACGIFFLRVIVILNHLNLLNHFTRTEPRRIISSTIYAQHLCTIYNYTAEFFWSSTRPIGINSFFAKTARVA